MDGNDGKGDLERARQMEAFVQNSTPQTIGDLRLVHEKEEEEDQKLEILNSK